MIPMVGGAARRQRKSRLRGWAANVFVVREGKLYTPSERYVLPAFSRQMTLDLARKLAISVIEGDI